MTQEPSFTIHRVNDELVMDMRNLPTGRDARTWHTDLVSGELRRVYGGAWTVVKLGGAWFINHDGASRSSGRRLLALALRDATGLRALV